MYIEELTLMKNVTNFVETNFLFADEFANSISRVCVKIVWKLDKYVHELKFNSIELASIVQSGLSTSLLVFILERLTT